MPASENGSTPTQTTATTTAVRRPAGQAHRRDSRSTANQIAKGLLLGVFVLGIGTGLFFRFKTARFVNLVSPQAMDAGQIAYNLRMYKTLATRVTYPLALTGSHPDTKGYDIGCHPLYPVVLAAFFKTRGVSDDTVVMVNALCMLALAWVLYGIVLMAYDKSAAVWSVLAYFVSVQIIGMALTADGVMLTALLFSLAVLLGLHALRRSQAESAPDAPQRASSRLSSPWPWLVGVGLAGGLAYLAGRFSPLLWVVLAAAVTANMGRSRRAAAAVVLLAALLLGGLWWGRNLAALGTPWPVLERSELVMGTREYPGSSLLWSVTGGPANPVFYLITHPRDTFVKLATGAAAFYRSIPDVANLYLFPFLVGGLLWLPKTPERRLLWTVFLWALVTQVAVSIITVPTDAALGLLRPLAVGLAVAALVQWLRGVRMPGVARVLATLGVTLVLALPYAAGVLRGGIVQPSPSVAAMAQLPKWLDIPDKAVFLTDNPWIVAWYGRYRSILLPDTPPDLDKMAKLLAHPPYFMYFTAAGPRKGSSQQDAWPKLLSDPRQASRMGLPLPLPNREFLVLTPLGMKESPKSVERFKLIYAKMQQESKKPPTAAAPPGGQPQGGP